MNMHPCFFCINTEKWAMHATQQKMLSCEIVKVFSKVIASSYNHQCRRNSAVLHSPQWLILLVSSNVIYFRKYIVNIQIYIYSHTYIAYIYTYNVWCMCIHCVYMYVYYICVYYVHT